MPTEYASPRFDSYRRQYDARTPDLKNQRSDDETQNVCANSDVFSLRVAPAPEVLVGAHPTARYSAGEKMHVWLVLPDDVVYSEEAGASGMKTERKRLSHTNLSGGGKAHCGGELWFRDDHSIWLTGGSSRYAPRTQEELDLIVNSFVDSGYSVCSCGWDEEMAGPARFFRGSEKWLTNHEN
jgi:hypothetical protein